MKVVSLITFLILSFGLFASTEYGGKISLKSPISLKTAITKLNKKDSATVLVTAKVGKVCKKKGCWMTLEDKTGDIRVTFKDYSFFVPFGLVGKEVLIEGELISHTMTVKEAKHYASDAGENPDHVKKEVKEFRMIATAVKVL